MKLRKIFSAVIAAVMCVAMAGTVRADNTGNAFWQEAKEISGAKYYPSLMKLAEKYYNKERNKTITYGKSFTKKFYTRLYNEVTAEEPEFSISLCDDESVIHMSVKYEGEHYKYVESWDDYLLVLYTDSTDSAILYGDGDSRRYLYAASEGSVSNGAYLEDLNVDSIAEMAARPDSEKGKYFKIKYKEKIYVYEEFGGEGILFTEKGTPVVMMGDGGALSVQVSYKVDDSVFKVTVPDGYEPME